MSKKLKENQIIAAKLISFGFSSRSVSKWINVREKQFLDGKLKSFNKK